jgi:hypothetical protein
MDEPAQCLAADDQIPRNAAGLGAGDYAAELIGRFFFPQQILIITSGHLLTSVKSVSLPSRWAELFNDLVGDIAPLRGRDRSFHMFYKPTGAV